MRIHKPCALLDGRVLGRVGVLGGGGGGGARRSRVAYGRWYVGYVFAGAMGGGAAFAGSGLLVVDGAKRVEW